jgi:hypothetical protein
MHSNRGAGGLHFTPAALRSFSARNAPPREVLPTTSDLRRATKARAAARSRWRDRRRGASRNRPRGRPCGPRRRVTPQHARAASQMPAAIAALACRSRAMSSSEIQIGPRGPCGCSRSLYPTVSSGTSASPARGEDPAVKRPAFGPRKPWRRPPTENRRRPSRRYRSEPGAPSADHAEMGGERRGAQADALDGSAHAARTAGESGALEGRTGGGGAAERRPPTLGDDLAIGADVDQQRGPLVVEHPVAATPAGQIRADIGGRSRQQMNHGVRPAEASPSSPGAVDTVLEKHRA